MAAQGSAPRTSAPIGGLGVDREGQNSATGNDARTTALDYEALPVVEQLIIETLTARVRLGEHMWTFTRRVQRQLRHLERLGWIGWKHGIVQWTCLVWFTAAGRSAAMDNGYIPPSAREQFSVVVESVRSSLDQESPNENEPETWEYGALFEGETDPADYGVYSTALEAEDNATEHALEGIDTWKILRRHPGAAPAGPWEPVSP